MSACIGNFPGFLGLFNLFSPPLFLSKNIQTSGKKVTIPNMPKDIVQVEIKRIPLEIESAGLGMVELTDLAASVEQYMLQLQEEGEVDTLKQALLTALHFAAQSYLQTQNEGGKRKEEESRMDDLILKLKSYLDSTHK